MHRVRPFAFVLAVVFALTASPAIAAIRITKIVYDPSGPDYRTKRQLHREYVVIHNTSGKGRQLRGWVLRDRAGHRFTFPSYRIGPNGYVKVHTGKGRDRRGDVYWDSGNFIWNNDGDKAWVRTPGGTTTDTCTYAGGESPNPPKKC
jgi:hypothetical protein